MSRKSFRLLRNPALSLRILRHRLLLWSGAIAVALAAILFARTSVLGNDLFGRAVRISPLLAYVITPAAFAAILWLTRSLFAGAEGSGIPQTIAALQLPVLAQRRSVLSLRVAAGKILLTTLGLCAGASIGREGPTVQIGAAIMHNLGRWVHLPVKGMERALVLAGGAAGIAAAFNTPLAGVVFAIEELSRSFEERTSGAVLTAVIVSGIGSMAVLGNYTYFGRTDAVLDLMQAWRPVLACGIGGGLLGGLFARVLIGFSRGLPGRAGRWIGAHPVAFAAVCGLALAALGQWSNDTVYGTGYQEARGLIEGGTSLPASFGLMKLGATVLSYASGIPGGIFAPSLAVGAGLGADVAHFLPGVPVGAVVILGMVGYFTGVVQAPITAVVIVMEMTDNQALVIPLMATALIGFGVSKMVCPTSFYRALAQTFLEKMARRRDRPDAAPANPA
ncbi:chloride channel protein [Telmatospirillum siberiense]|uniref:Chloride channel protein n=1 Tax=Telmatospirillum siberiense TaxID=382514 RepID=A0A2N3PXV0_9PROT|nr:chloride channel protein [Telmatospirillum siberiense]PKU25250.1 chloride channel protein [Telmatospirillum siberiense]